MVTFILQKGHCVCNVRLWGTTFSTPHYIAKTAHIVSLRSICFCFCGYFFPRHIYHPLCCGWPSGWFPGFCCQAGATMPNPVTSPVVSVQSYSQVCNCWAHDCLALPDRVIVLAEVLGYHRTPMLIRQGTKALAGKPTSFTQCSHGICHTFDECSDTWEVRGLPTLQSSPVGEPGMSVSAMYFVATLSSLVV